MALAFGDSVSASIPWDDGHADSLGLDALLARPAWHRDALCTEYPDVDFFPLPGDDLEPALAVCRRCSVAKECGSWAAEKGVRDGVWGAVLMDARKRPRVNQGRVVSSQGAQRRDLPAVVADPLATSSGRH